MLRLRQFPTAAVLTLLYACFLFTNMVTADSFMATINGSIAEGSLNSTDLAGRDFMLTAVLSDPTDLFDQLPEGAAFAAETGSINFGGGDIFDFDVDQLAVIVTSYLSSTDSNPAFQMGFTTTPINSENHDENAIGYTDWSTTIPLFDSNILQEVPFHDEFDRVEIAGPFTATNTTGDTLTITLAASPPAPVSTQIVAIPEPTTGALLVIGALSSFSRRPRKCMLASKS